MDLIGENPILNLSDRTFRIYSRNYTRPPQFIGDDATTVNSMISEGCYVNGTVVNSVISGGVIIEKGAIVRDSVIMEDVVIQSGACVYSAIIDADCVIESGATFGVEGAGKENISIIGKGTVVHAVAPREA